jgi:deoxycytidine triphosphate deaminase
MRPDRQWWEEPEELLTDAYWKDPMPGWQGMLSSDLIAFYNEQVGGMIIPWDSRLVKPAAYELTLGPVYLSQGERKELSRESPWLELPKNSIVFVTMQQMIRLPHYIAARFDLAIEFIYQGILLGTGPQVDPGFRGALSCPLHNISDQSVHLKLGEPFAKMDFAKTSGLWKQEVDPQAVLDTEVENDLYELVRSGELTGAGGNPIALFNEKKRYRQPIFDAGYAGYRPVKSSVKEIDDRVVENEREVERFGDEITRLRRFGLASGIAIVLAIAGLLITLAQLDRSYTDSKFGSVHTGSPGASVLLMRKQIKSEQRDLANLKRAIRRLHENLRTVRH